MRTFKVEAAKNFRHKNTRGMTRAQARRFKAMGNANRIARPSKPRKGVVIAVSSNIASKTFFVEPRDQEEE